MPWAGPPPPIVADFGCNEQEYSSGSRHEDAPRPGGCLSCGQKGCLIGHGYYRRKPRDQLRAYPLRIKRWLCKECGRTNSVLPSFLLRHRHYLLRVIEVELVRRFEGQASWAVILAEYAGSGYPALRTLQRWCATFGEQAQRWLKAVQEWLAQQDSHSGWLDAQGEALQADSPEQALLTASEHLLAWAKSQWAELAEYGLEKRLSFLWQWGASQGLGRLV